MTPGGVHLMVDEDDGAIPTGRMWIPPYHQAGASNVEATAYLLLTYVNTKNILKSASVVEWLTRQRNPNGGFQSTQVQQMFSLQFANNGPLAST